MDLRGQSRHLVAVLRREVAGAVGVLRIRRPRRIVVDDDVRGLDEALPLRDLEKQRLERHFLTLL